MNPCRFIKIASWDGWECEVCHRRLSSMTVRILNGQLLVAACGVASDYDEGPDPTSRVLSRVTIHPIRRENELIGQEGGVWDKFYLEGG